MDASHAALAVDEAEYVAFEGRDSDALSRRIRGDFGNGVGVHQFGHRATDVKASLGNLSLADARVVALKRPDLGCVGVDVAEDHGVFAKVDLFLLLPGLVLGFAHRAVEGRGVGPLFLLIIRDVVAQKAGVENEITTGADECPFFHRSAALGTLHQSRSRSFQLT